MIVIAVVALCLVGAAVFALAGALIGFFYNRLAKTSA